MTSLTAMKTAALVLAVTALGGMLMAAMRLGGRDRPPQLFAVGHGLLAAGALGLLLYAWATTGLPAMAQIATLVLMLAAAGGLYVNLRFHRVGLPLPIGIMSGHILVAVGGFLLLATAVMREGASVAPTS